MYSDPDWRTFESLAQEGSDKGIFLSFITQAGTNVPPWCVNGGEDAVVRKMRTDEGQAAIEVPEKIFNLYTGN